MNEPEKSDLSVVKTSNQPPKAILYGVRCLWCDGHLAAPERGPTPKTCSARCRRALARHRAKRNAG